MTDDFKKWLHKEFPMAHQTGFNVVLWFEELAFVMQEGIYRKFIREEKHVVINVYRNGSGWLWGMHMVRSGTDLGWSAFTGDNKNSGTFTSYEKAFMDVVDLELNYGCYHEASKDKSIIGGHWRLYVRHLQKLRSNAK